MTLRFILRSLSLRPVAAAVTGFLLLAFAASPATAQSRNILIEIFTNSHCPLCPPAHSAISSYLSGSSNADRVTLIAYHTLFPYSSDVLAQANTSDPAARYGYYGSSSSTPITYFDGVDQGRSYSSWGGAIDARLAVSSPLDIVLTGSVNGSTFSAQCVLTRTESIPQNDLVLHIAVVENVSYVGGNGVSNDHVFRQFLTPSGGSAVQFDGNGGWSTAASGAVTNLENITGTSIVAFVQSTSTKEVYQSRIIPFASLTGIGDVGQPVPSDIDLLQNYPNPFNPSTTIAFRISDPGRVVITVTNMLGVEIGTVLDEALPRGTHTRQWDASGFPSGTYLVSLRTGSSRVTRRILLLR